MPEVGNQLVPVFLGETFMIKTSQSDWLTVVISDLGRLCREALSRRPDWDTESFKALPDKKRPEPNTTSCRQSQKFIWPVVLEM